MAWVTVSEDMLSSRLTVAEMSALRYTQTEAGDPTEEILDRVVEEARGYLGARPDGGSLGPSGTVPSQVLGPVLDIARYRLLSRLAVGRGAGNLVTDARITEYKDALQTLKDIASGAFRISEPATAAETLKPAPSPKIKAKPTSSL